jgi:sugar phosphate isomerase/epimerase
MEDLVGRHDTLGKEFACQFLQSANIDVGTFALPVKIGGTDAEYAAFIKKLDTIADLASTLDGKQCYVLIEPFSNTSAFQENFEKHRTRLHEIGEKLAKYNIRVGLALQAAKAKTSKGEYKFIQSAEDLLTLVKTVGHPNVGLCLDSWQWVVGGGGMDQIADINPKVITEFRMADVSDTADLNAIKISDRVLPGNAVDSISVKMINHLLDAGYEGPFSVATDLGMFAGVARDVVVDRLSERLDKLIAREDLSSIHDDTDLNEDQDESVGESEDDTAAVGATATQS